MIEADLDCAHPSFDIAGRCRVCGRDFAEQRAAGERSEAEIANPSYEAIMDSLYGEAWRLA